MLVFFVESRYVILKYQCTLSTDMFFSFHWWSYYILRVFSESPNNSGLQGTSFCYQRSAFLTFEIPIVLLVIHDVAFVCICSRNDIQIKDCWRWWLHALLVDLFLYGFLLRFLYIDDQCLKSWILEVWDTLLLAPMTDLR